MFFSGVSETGLEIGTQSSNSQVKLQEELNRFLNLLVTQLKHQDPLDPMDASEFTSQLVQFASVEQQIYQNSNLEKLLQLQQSSHVASMVSYLGTTVEAAGTTMPLVDGRAEFSYSTTRAASEVTVIIRDSSGSTVYSVAGETDTGVHKFVWDGKSAGGLENPDGAYTVTVTGLDRDGNIIDVAHRVTGKVTGVSSEDGEFSLYMGDVAISMDDVISIRETPPADPV